MEAHGFKRMNETRLFSDANPSFSYPGGTSIADATVTHAFNFQSAFPNQATELFFIWGCNARIDSGEDVNEPRGRAAITLADGTVLTNIVTLGMERNLDGSGYIDGVLTASGATQKAAGVTDITFQQRCFMTYGDINAVMSVDNADILIREYVT